MDLVAKVYNNLTEKEKNEYKACAIVSLMEHGTKQAELTESLIEFFIKDTLIRNELFNGFRDKTTGELI